MVISKCDEMARPAQCEQFAHIKKQDEQEALRKSLPPETDDLHVMKKRPKTDNPKQNPVRSCVHQLGSKFSNKDDSIRQHNPDEHVQPADKYTSADKYVQPADKYTLQPENPVQSSHIQQTTQVNVQSKVHANSKQNHKQTKHNHKKSTYAPTNALMEKEFLTDICGNPIHTSKSKSPFKRKSPPFKQSNPGKKPKTISQSSTKGSPFPDPRTLSDEERKNYQWTELYRPRTCSEIVGNSKNIEKLRIWMKKHESKSKTDLIILLHGPPGIGKTSTIHALFREFGFNVYEVNASLVRTANDIHQELLDVVPRVGLSGRTAVILDELDGGVEKSTDENGVDCSAVNGILNFMKWVKDSKKDTTSWSPVVCIANDVSGKAMQRLTHSIPTFRFFKPFTSDLSKIMNKVVRIEKIKITEGDKGKLIESANGDVRKLLVSLQLYASTPNTTMKSFSSMSGKDLYWDTFRSISLLLYGQMWSWEQMFHQIQSDQSIAMLMLQENHVQLFVEKFPSQGRAMSDGKMCEHNCIPKSCPKCKSQLAALNDMSEFANSFSMIDWFESSVPTYQEWHEETKNSMAGLATSAIRVCRAQRHKGVEDPTIKFTGFFNFIKSQRSTRDVQNDLLRKNHIHTSGVKRVESINCLRRTNQLVLKDATDMEHFNELMFV